MWLALGWIAVAGAQDLCPGSPKTAPGVCGCAAEDVDADGDLAQDSCIDFTAVVDPSASFGPGATVEAYAQVGASTFGSDAWIGARATVGDGSVIGSDASIGRRASIGDGVTLGDNATIGRAASILPGVDAGTWLSMGYASSLGGGTVVGDRVTLGALADVRAQSLGDDVIIARGGDLETGVTVGLSTVLGPDVMIGANTRVGTDGRVRKGVRMGADSVVGDNVSIGRDTIIADNASIADSATLRALVQVRTRGQVTVGEYIPRGAIVESSLGDGIGVLTHARDGWGLAQASPVFPFKTWLQPAVANDLHTTLTEVGTIDDAALAGLSTFILVADGQACSYSGGACRDPGISTAEREALTRFVLAGGGLLVFRGYNVGAVIPGMFGTLDYSTSCAGSGSVTLQPSPPATLGSDGPYGAMPASAGWSGNCHYSVTGSTTGSVPLYRNAGGFNEVVVIPPGALSPGSGPVALAGDFHNSYSGMPADFSVVVQNLVAFVEGYQP